MTFPIRRDLLLVALGRVASILVALISMRVVTHYLSPSQYGQLSILYTIQMFCGLLLINPVGQYINIKTHEWWEHKTLIERLSSYWMYILFVTLFGVCIFCYVGYFIGSFDSISAGMLAIAAAIFFGTWSATLIPMLNMLGFREPSIILGVLTSALGLMLSALLTNFFPGESAWLLGQALGFALGGLLGWRLLIKYSGYGISILKEKKLKIINKTIFFNYCLPLAIATGFMWLQLSGYRFLIEKYWGIANLGFLVLGFQIASQVWGLVESLATQYLYPLFFKKVGAGSDQQVIQQAYSDLINTLIPVYLVVNGAMLMASGALLKILVSSTYSGAINFVILGTFIEMFRTIGNVLSNAAHVKGRTIALAIPYIVGSLCTILAIYIAAFLTLDLIWAAISVLIGIGITLALMCISMRRQIPFSIDYMRWVGAFFVMLLMGYLAEYMPTATSFSGAVEDLLITTSCSAAVFLFLLLNNPASTRLMSTKL